MAAIRQGIIYHIAGSYLFGIMANSGYQLLYFNWVYFVPGIQNQERFGINIPVG